MRLFRIDSKPDFYPFNKTEQEVGEKKGKGKGKKNRLSKTN